MLLPEQPQHVGGWDAPARQAFLSTGVPELKGPTSQQLDDANAGHEASFNTHNCDTGHFCMQASPYPALIMLQST